MVYGVDMFKWLIRIFEKELDEVMREKSDGIDGTAFMIKHKGKMVFMIDIDEVVSQFIGSTIEGMKKKDDVIISHSNKKVIKCQ